MAARSPAFAAAENELPDITAAMDERPRLYVVPRRLRPAG
jgi:hypothetical protein